VGDVVAKPRTGFGLKPAYPKSSNGLILVLTPKKSPGDQSLTSHLALECAKLAEDAMAVSDKELRHKLPIAPALVAYKMQSFGQDVIAWGGSDTADVSDAAGMPTVPAESTVAASVTGTSQPVQPSQPSQPSQSSYAPMTPRVSISVWQKIAELDSFDVDAWCRDMQQHGRSSSDQIIELSKIVSQFQDLLRFLASQVLSNHGNTGPREAHGEPRESQDSMVSPRLIASPYPTTPSRQVLPAHGTHSLASTGNLVALSPRNPTDPRGESLSSSPLTRSCSANYPVGSVLPQKGGTWSGLREVQSPKTLTRDLSPAELRMLNASPQPLPGNMRHQMQAASPWQALSVPSTLMAQLHPQEGQILRSPRTEQGRDRGEGQRSPMPQPPQFAKAHPHSARAASGIVFVPGQYPDHILHEALQK